MTLVTRAREMFLSFADDTTLYTSHSNLTKLHENANEQVNDFYAWFCSNRLSLNVKKTKYIIIRMNTYEK